MTDDPELLALARQLELEHTMRAKAGEQPPDSVTSIVRKPMEFRDTQLIGYRPRTRPGAKTKFWRVLKGICIVFIFVVLAAML